MTTKWWKIERQSISQPVLNATAIKGQYFQSVKAVIYKQSLLYYNQTRKTSWSFWESDSLREVMLLGHVWPFACEMTHSHLDKLSQDEATLSPRLFLCSSQAIYCLLVGNTVNTTTSLSKNKMPGPVAVTSSSSLWTRVSGCFVNDFRFRNRPSHNLGTFCPHNMPVEVQGNAAGAKYLLRLFNSFCESF